MADFITWLPLVIYSANIDPIGANKEDLKEDPILLICLTTGRIAAASGVIFGVITAVRKKSPEAGILLFWLSFLGCFFGALVGLFTGGLWVYWMLESNPDLTNPRLHALSEAGITIALLVRWLLCWLVGSILGAILGGICGLRFYKSRASRR